MPRDRRGGRAVECTGLENRRPFTGLVSSNLTLSAKLQGFYRHHLRLNTLFLAWICIKICTGCIFGTILYRVRACTSAYKAAVIEWSAGKASYTRIRNGDDTVSSVAQVRVKPFKPTAKSYPTRPAAKEWAEAKEKELKEQRKHGADRTDLPALSVKTLVDEFLADGETKAL